MNRDLLCFVRRVLLVTIAALVPVVTTAFVSTASIQTVAEQVADGIRPHVS